MRMMPRHPPVCLCALRMWVGRAEQVSENDWLEASLNIAMLFSTSEYAACT